MKYNVIAMNNNENKRPTSLLIPKTSPFAKTKFLLAINAIMNPETMAPKTPTTPTQSPISHAMHATITVDAK